MHRYRIRRRIVDALARIAAYLLIRSAIRKGL